MTIRELAGRIISVLIALFYVTGAFFQGGPVGAVKCATVIVFPLACIWFSEAMGDYTGGSGRGAITNTSPDWLIAILGWLLLLAPLIAFTILGLKSLLFG